MFKLFAFVVSLVLLVGCSSKKKNNLMALYEAKIEQGKMLQKTEKIQLYEGELTKVGLVATYLYLPSAKQTEDEKFIVGVHSDEEPLKEIYGNGNHLTLNGKEMQTIELLQPEDPRIKTASLTNQWNRYYLVTFPRIQEPKMVLHYEHHLYGSGDLYFAKVAKYLVKE
jgi:hypothetical protein